MSSPIMDTPSSKAAITIAGAGPVGALLAVILGRAGYRVNLYESRPDSRKHSIYQGKSINIALSDRGWLALESVGIADEIRQQAIPMTKRIMHSLDGKLTHQPYGKKGQAIWSVSRAGINEQLLDLAEQENLVSLHFEQQLTHVSFSDATASFLQKKNVNLSHKNLPEPQPVNADYLFAADGAHSKVRRLAQETPRFSYSHAYMPQSYIELNISPNSDGSAKLEMGALHIWPRKDFMLIALPNTDKSFTCTLFLNYEGDISFAALDTEQKVTDFFHHNFADAMALLDDPINTFIKKSPNPLFLVSVDPWVINNKVALIGDAAHAMVPFYGQGMNCGFEDCRVLSELIYKHNHDWTNIFPAYQHQRKVNADAITQMAKDHFVEMSELSGKAQFLIQKQIEAKFHALYPELWTPLYSMVTFSPHLPYLEALKKGEQQKAIMKEIMQIEEIESYWQDDFVYQKMKQLCLNTP